MITLRAERLSSLLKDQFILQLKDQFILYGQGTPSPMWNALSEPLGELVVHLLIFLTIVRILWIPLSCDWSANSIISELHHFHFIHNTAILKTQTQSKKMENSI